MEPVKSTPTTTLSAEKRTPTTTLSASTPAPEAYTPTAPATPEGNNFTSFLACVVEPEKSTPTTTLSAEKPTPTTTLSESNSIKSILRQPKYSQQPKPAVKEQVCHQFAAQDGWTQRQGWAQQVSHRVGAVMAWYTVNVLGQHTKKVQFASDLITVKEYVIPGAFKTFCQGILYARGQHACKPGFIMIPGLYTRAAFVGLSKLHATAATTTPAEPKTEPVPTTPTALAPTTSTTANTLSCSDGDDQMDELVAAFAKLKIEIITPASELDELADLCQLQWSFTDSAPAPTSRPPTRPPTPIVVEDVPDCEDPELKALKCVLRNRRPGADEPFMVPIECK